jgi:predicted P-loop ATPase
MRDLAIAYGNSCFAKNWSNKTIRFAELCSRLEHTIRTSETVEEYPKLPKAERDRAKDKGGFVGGHLKGNRRKRENMAYRSMLTHDADHADKDFISRYEAEHQYTSCLYTTHGHTPIAPRVRIIVPLARDVTPDEYIAIARYFSAELGMDMFDECSYRPHQLMYWPTTPANGEYVFKCFDGEWLDPDKYLAKHPNWRDCSLLPTSSRESKVTDHTGQHQEDPLAKPGIIGTFCRTYSMPETIEKFLSVVYAPSAIEGRYDYIPADSTAGVVVYDNKFAYSHHATDPACGQLLNAFDIIRIHKFGRLDDRAAAGVSPSKLPSFKEMCRFAVEDDKVKLAIALERQQEALDDFTDDTNWLSHLEYEPRSKVLKNNLRNLTLILENDPNLEGIVFNQHMDGLEIKGEVPWSHPSKFWRDADDAQLISYIDRHYGTFSARNYEIAVTKVADDRSYHPIREYIDSLPDWDQTPRVDTLLIDYLGAEDNEYVRAVTRKTLCAAIARVLNPGCKFDSMLVLNGPQGIGKSTLILKLAGEWFSDSLNLSDTKDKTAAEKLQGYWILEIGELAGLRKAEVETLRSFISRQNDIYRASFGRRATPHLRQCVFFGTTNAVSGYLRDTTGNRRFWPVKTPGGKVKHSWQLSDYEIQQIWAEALVYVKKGEKLYLNNNIEKLAKAEQREALESDEREGLVREYLDTLLPEDWHSMDLFERRNFLNGSEFGGENRTGTKKREAVSNMEIWCECFGKERANLRRIDANDISAMITRIGGWERSKLKVRIPLYGPQWIYVPKSACSNE